MRLHESDSCLKFLNVRTCVVFGGDISDSLLPCRELLLLDDNSDDFRDDELSFSSNLNEN